MSNTTILIIGGIVLVAVFLLIARLAVRLVVRLIIVGVILIALLGGAGFLWWANRLTATPPQNRQPAKRSNIR
jgi:nitrate reductase NapE component